MFPYFCFKELHTMKKIPLLVNAFFLVFVAFSGPLIFAQNAVVNPQFSTLDLQNWEGLDPLMYVATGPQFLGMDFVCLQKFPGLPDNNGSITQEVHLIKGYTYWFSANIAAQYCPS
jgi:hypothetical protein